MKKSLALLAILLVAPVAACGSSGDESGGASPNAPSGAGGEPASSAALAGQTFVATEAKGVEITDRVRLKIAFEERRMSVDAGCNRIGGNYSLEEGEIQSFLSSTLMGCPPRETALEVFASELLRQGAEARISGDTLSLEGKNGTSLTLASQV